LTGGRRVPEANDEEARPRARRRVRRQIFIFTYFTGLVKSSK
jgi:hypothetical protein